MVNRECERHTHTHTHTHTHIWRCFQGEAVLEKDLKKRSQYQIRERRCKETQRRRQENAAFGGRTGWIPAPDDQEPVRKRAGTSHKIQDARVKPGC
jgi:hypothetical protein